MAKESRLEKILPELAQIETCIRALKPYGRVRTLTRVRCKDYTFPVHALSLGPEDKTTPVLGIFAGVHGLERIGTQVAISYMQSLAELLKWDRYMQDVLERVRLVFVPLINPGGMYLQQRSNPHGVDLMRNSPVEADKIPPIQIISGHRYGPRLPWYRGRDGAAMEDETAAVSRFVQAEFFNAKVGISLDLHSGFGLRDRLWFPYAKSRKPVANVAEIYALIDLLERTFPNNVYKIEPQSRSYTAHGDLWDHLYDEFREQQTAGNVFLPLSLELGSWVWVKKNPKQLFSLLGVFNPVVHHRMQRTMRRHWGLFDFLLRAVDAHDRWAYLESAKKRQLKEHALSEWYSDVKAVPEES